MIERISPPEQPLRTQQPAQQPEEAPEGPGGGGQPRTGPNQPMRGQPGAATEDITTQEFVIVNTREPELDYSFGGEGNEVIANEYTHYDGTGGVRINSFFRRLAFAARFRDVRILFSNLFTDDSRIQFNRSLPERLAAIAPFLMYDPDPYLVVDEDGTLKWVNDAYAVSGKYPYSDPLRPLGNYFRNSVKVFCDAYDGAPEFYIIDEADPVAQCYRKIFPTLFRSRGEISEYMHAHLRVPQLLFTIQVGVYADYHMTTPEVFFQKEDRWAMPPEIYSFGRRMVEAYYVVQQLPGEDEAEFLIMMPLVLSGQEERNMVAWMAARCDPEHYGEIIVFNFPKERLTYGPWQIESRISQDAEISAQITLWSQAGSNVIRGNLLVIPLLNSLLYVEPLYLEAQDTGLPEMRRVILAYGEEIVWGVNLEAALAELFGTIDGRAEVPAGAEVAEPAGPEVSPELLESLRTLIDRVLQLDREAQEAQAGGDFQTYLRKNQEQSEALRLLEQQVNP